MTSLASGPENAGVPTALTRRMEVIGGYDLRDTSPARDCGICAARMVFYVIGPKGAVQWMIGTDWYVATARDHVKRFHGGRGEPSKYLPDGWDLGYHSHKPMYDDQRPMDGKCEVIGGTCYYDGSGLNADLLIEGFIAGGTEWLWPQLEAYYRHVFDGAEFPAFKPVYRQRREAKAS